MSYNILMLILAAIPIGFLHTLMGPDHYVPFVAMARTRNWSMTKTLWITTLCGIGHVLSAVILGVVGIAVGFTFTKFKFIETWRGELAAWLLISFGLVYFVWGLRAVLKHRRHSHQHFFHRHFNHDYLHDENETVPAHNHKYQERCHDHALTHCHEQVHTPVPCRELTPWVLFVIFILGPCEPLIPLMMYPAINSTKLYVFFVCLAFGVTTVATMILSVVATLYGMRFIKINFWEKYGSAVAGGIICCLGLGIKFLGL